MVRSATEMRPAAARRAVIGEGQKPYAVAWLTDMVLRSRGVDATERLRVAARGENTLLRIEVQPVTDALLGRLPVGDLTLVLAESGELSVQGVGDIDVDVGAASSSGHDPHLVNGTGL